MSNLWLSKIYGRLDIPEFSTMFFKMPELLFLGAIDLYALECHFSPQNVFTGYMLWRWSWLFVILFGCGVGAVVYNIYCLALSLWRHCKKGRKDEGREQGVIGRDCPAKNYASFINFRSYLQFCIFAIITLFALLSRTTLDFFNCMRHPAPTADLSMATSSNGVPNDNSRYPWTHRIFRYVLCNESNSNSEYESLFPIAVVLAVSLLFLPIFIIRQAWKLRKLAIVVSKMKRDQGEREGVVPDQQRILTQKRAKWGFLWTGFHDKFAFWNAVIMIKDILLALVGNFIPPGSPQGCVASVILIIYFGMVLRYRPFSEPKANTLELVLTLLLALIALASALVTQSKIISSERDSAREKSLADE